MNRNRFFTNALVIFASLFLVAGYQPTSINAADAAKDLQWSVRRLNTWLGDSSHAIGWRKYLLLNILESQAAKGHQADAKMLSQVYERFNSGTSGLNHPVFLDVKHSIARQINSLATSYRGPMAHALMSHFDKYQPILGGTFEQYRDRAQYDLDVMKRFYRATMASRPRANLFYDLQLDPMLDFIDSVQFETAPEVSVGKLTSMLNDKKRELRDVIREIDALPAEDNEVAQPKEGEVELDAPDGAIVDGPVPDDSSPLQLLEQKRDTLKAAVVELTAKRKKVLQADRPRLIRRRDTIRDMRGYSQRFEKIAKKQFDPYFVSAAKSYQAFIQAYANGTADNLQEDMLRRMQVLSEDMPLLGQPDERRAAGRVGNLLEWFENSNQVPTLVSAIRREYSCPNVYLNISSNLINSIAGQSNVDSQVMDESVGGRHIRGYTTTLNNVSVDLQDDPNQVHLSLHLLGSIHSAFRFRAAKFYGFVNATGQFEGRRSLYANIGGLFAGNTKVAVCIDSQFLGLTTRSPLIQRLAFKQFYKGKADADANAAMRAEAEAFDQFDSQTSDAVAQGQDTVFDINDRAIDYSAWIPDLYLRSRPNFIELVGKKDSAKTLAAPNYPEAGTVPVDVMVRLHDSLLSNYVDPIFAGKTFTNEELAAEAAELFGEMPEGLVTEEEEGKDESFSITFDNVRPIQFEFDGNALTISISGKQFAQGERKIDAGLQIQLRFKITRTTDGLQLVRDGDAVLEYTDPDNKDAKIVAFKSFLEDKLNAEAIQSNAIDLPDNLLPVDKIEALKSNQIAKELQLVQCAIENGWLSLGWRHLPPSMSSVGYPTDLRAIWNEVVIDQYEKNFNQSGQSVLSPDEKASPVPAIEGALEVQ